MAGAMHVLLNNRCIGSASEGLGARDFRAF